MNENEMSDIEAIHLDIEEGEILDDEFDLGKENTTRNDVLSYQDQSKSFIPNQHTIKEKNHQTNFRKRKIIEPVNDIKKPKPDLSYTSDINEDDHNRKTNNYKQRICSYYQKTGCKWGNNCKFLHIGPQKTFELCKFYQSNSCVKNDKCTYMHSDFPCKYFHAGSNCDQDTCAFSHEPLTAFTSRILLKHIERAPKTILGNFPRKQDNDEVIPSLFEINVEPPPELSSIAEAGVKSLEELDKKLANEDKAKNITDFKYQLFQLKSKIKKREKQKETNSDEDTDDDDVLVIDLDPTDKKDLSSISKGSEESGTETNLFDNDSFTDSDDDNYLINVLKNYRKNTIKEEPTKLSNIDLSKIEISSDLRNLINKIGNKNTSELPSNPFQDIDLRQILNQKRPVDTDLRTENYSYNLPFKQIIPSVCEEINGSIFLYPTIEYELIELEEIEKPDYSHIKINEYNMNNGSISRDPRLKTYIEKYKQSLILNEKIDPRLNSPSYKRTLKTTAGVNYSFFASFTKPLGVRDSPPESTNTSDPPPTTSNNTSDPLPSTSTSNRDHPPATITNNGDFPPSTSTNTQNVHYFNQPFGRSLWNDDPPQYTENRHQYQGKRKVTRKEFIEWNK